MDLTSIAKQFHALPSLHRLRAYGLPVDDSLALPSYVYLFLFGQAERSADSSSYMFHAKPCLVFFKRRCQTDALTYPLKFVGKADTTCPNCGHLMHTSRLDKDVLFPKRRNNETTAHADATIMGRRRHAGLGRHETTRRAGYPTGVLLLMMVVNHSPSSLRRLTDQPIGFLTTAEVLVFVSALLAGMLFRKRMEKHGFDAARSFTIHQPRAQRRL